MHPIWKVLIVLSAGISAVCVAMVAAGDTASAGIVAMYGFGAVVFVIVSGVLLGIGEGGD